MKKLVVVALFLFIEPAILHAVEFSTLGFDAALTQAKKDNKVVFIDFFTTWCGPCERLNQRTWTDKGVCDWLKVHTIALKIDAEKENKLATKYNVYVYPTLLFVKADGSPIGRIVGFCEAPDFLKRAQAIMSGGDSLARVQKTLQENRANNPEKRLEYANKLVDLGKNEEALKEYLWCFDKGVKHMGRLIRDIARLGANYAPAKEALIAQYTNALEAVKRSDISRQTIMYWLTLLRFLPEKKSDALAVYDELLPKAKSTGKVADLCMAFSDVLLENKRYSDLIQYGDMAVMAQRGLQLISKLKGKIESQNAEDREMARPLVEYFLQRYCSSYYLPCLATGRVDLAAIVAKKLLEVLPIAQTYHTLATTALASGKPLPADAGYAAKASELSEGKNAEIVETQARLLLKLNQPDQAVAAINACLKANNDETATKKLRDLLTEINMNRN